MIIYAHRLSRNVHCYLPMSTSVVTHLAGVPLSGACPFRAENRGCGRPVAPGACGPVRPSRSRAGVACWALHCCLLVRARGLVSLSARAAPRTIDLSIVRDATVETAATKGVRLRCSRKSSDDEQIIERVAALDIGKAEIARRVRLPGAGTVSWRVQEVSTTTMVGSLCEIGEPAGSGSGSNGW